MKVKELFVKHKVMLPYIFFGVCTTLVNIGIYWIAAHLCEIGIRASTVVAWIAAVLFAYFTNRRWVFQSEAEGYKEKIAECISFFLCRLATGVVDWCCMYIFVECLLWNDMLVKIGANILVIILNYIASKVLIFKRR